LLGPEHAPAGSGVYAGVVVYVVAGFALPAAYAEHEVERQEGVGYDMQQWNCSSLVEPCYIRQHMEEVASLMGIRRRPGEEFRSVDCRGEIPVP
jgi:hypothetical protein